MNRITLALLVAFASLAALAQQPATATKSDTQPKPVAIVNSDVITDQYIDMLYSRMSTQMRNQYEKNGGKKAFLENYISKRLIVQEALKHGFDKRPDIQMEVDAAKEGALFQAYIREQLASTVVTEADMKKYYDDNRENFAQPEAVSARHIIVMGNGTGPHPKSKQEAAAEIQKLAEDLRESVSKVTDPQAKARLLRSHFEDAAHQYSEDGSSQLGGDLGWIARGSFDPTFEAAAFALQPGTMSPVVETKFGYHLIYVEAKRPAGTVPFDQVRNDIREYLQSQRMSDIMSTVTKTSNELRGDSKISRFPENLH